MNCTKIAADLTAAVCGQPPLAGTGARAILLNYDDVDKNASTVTNNIISEIIMDAGTQGYAFTTIEDSMLGETTLNKGTYFESLQHDLSLRIHTKTQAAKDFVDDIVGSKIIAIVENLETGTAGEIKYEVYGWDAGLEVNELTATTDMADETVYVIKLGSGEKSKEGTLPKSFFDTDIATTETAITSLLSS
jgi:hypothetical protein